MNDTNEQDGPLSTMPLSQPPLYRTAAEALDIGTSQGVLDPRLSSAPNLRRVEDSRVPGFDHSHVIGPGQAAVDPIAAGLDIGGRPLSYQESRAVTLTGGQASGNPLDSTEHQTAAVSSGEIVPALPDETAAATPGPSAAAGPSEKDQQADQDSV